MRYDLTYKNYERMLKDALKSGFNFYTYNEYYNLNEKETNGNKIFVLRHDVDLDKNAEKSRELAKIEFKYKIKATYFIRVHDPEYNIFDFKTYYNIRDIINMEHEIGLHTEAYDFSIALKEDPKEIFIKEINVLESIFKIKINGCACHGDISNNNNLDFWKNSSTEDFGLKYEVYNKELNLFLNSKYISQHHGNNWKCYINGKFIIDDKRTIWEHISEDKEKGSLLYNVLIHPRPWFNVHWRLR